MPFFKSEDRNKMEKGRLFVKFDIEFPDRNVITPQICQVSGNYHTF
jgi:hypothetical protein